MQQPKRLYLIPSALRKNKSNMDEFKSWCADNNMDVTSEKYFSVKKQNGDLCRTFKNQKCNKAFLSLCRNFLINYKGHEMRYCNKREY